MSKQSLTLKAKIDGKDVELEIAPSDFEEFYKSILEHRQANELAHKNEIVREAAAIAVTVGKISTELLQRRLHIGYGRAASIIDELEEMGVIGPSCPPEPRAILISSMDEYPESKAQKGGPSVDHKRSNMSENEIFETALEIAARVHRGQIDKNGVAYILHPLAVAAQLDSLELKTIAILHDTIEDTEVTADYLLEKGIPKHIVDAVQLLSKPENEDYETYLKRVKENPLAKQVKLADLAHNTSPERASGLNEKRRAKYELAKRILTE